MNKKASSTLYTWTCLHICRHLCSPRCRYSTYALRTPSIILENWLYQFVTYFSRNQFVWEFSLHKVWTIEERRRNATTWGRRWENWRRHIQEYHRWRNSEYIIRVGTICVNLIMYTYHVYNLIMFVHVFNRNSPATTRTLAKKIESPLRFGFSPLPVSVDAVHAIGKNIWMKCMKSFFFGDFSVPRVFIHYFPTTIFAWTFSSNATACSFFVRSNFISCSINILYSLQNT